jgi:hypothetical protein
MNEPKQSISRRNALKILAAATGASALTLLPKSWKKPVVGVGALPAFAQGSLGTGDFQATLTWDAGASIPCNDEGQNGVDVDLSVIEPDSTVVGWFNPVGTTATLDFDNTCGFGPENIFVPDGGADNGDYDIYVSYYSGNVTTQATIRVRSFAGSGAGQTKTYHRTLTTADIGDLIGVARVSFPSGNITELVATKPAPAKARQGT